MFFLQDWAGETVAITRKDSKEFVGRVKSATASALILIPVTGRKTPQFFEAEEIEDIHCAPLPKQTSPRVDESNVRMHLLKEHGYNAPWSSPKDLIVLHNILHKREDENEYGRYGHIHLP